MSTHNKEEPGPEPDLELEKLARRGLFRRTLAPGTLAGLLLFGGLAPVPFLGLQGANTGLDTMAIALVVALLVICLGVHEAAHAWVANQCGDSTAKDLGRITLNPIPHIDPVMTIILPTMLVLSNAGFLFGGAKPVPVAYHRLRNPLRDMMLVALAGPVSNFLLAILFALAIGIFDEFRIYDRDQMMFTILQHGVHFNLLLAAFNMLPIPPLDGSRVMAWMLPSSLRSGYVALERFGLLILVGILIMPGPGSQVRALIWDFMETMRVAVEWIVNPIVDMLGSVL